MGWGTAACNRDQRDLGRVQKREAELQISEQVEETALTKRRDSGQSKGLEGRGQLRFWSRISNAPPLGGGSGVVGGVPHKTKKAFSHPKLASPLSVSK